MTIKRSILILDGHPDPSPDRFCHALASAYRTGAESAGHDVDLFRIADLEFPVLRSAVEFDASPVPEPLTMIRNRFLDADHMVLIYPLWLGTLPAFTKAFLEQLLHRDTAFEPAQPGKWPEGRLTGKSARVIVTMGMPTVAYRIWYGAHSLKSLERNILKFVGFRPVRDTLFGMVDQVSDATRKTWLDKVETLGRRAA